jgi:ABC-2 type transport system ATP-binding protein
VAIIDRGRVVAAGRPSDLAEAKGVEVETAAGVRRYRDARRADVPRLVAELVAAGESIYEVRVVRSDLEEVYLEAIGREGGDK